MQNAQPGQERPYVTIDDRDFLQAARGRRIYRSLGGCVLKRGRPGARNERVERIFRRAVEAGWIHAQPDDQGIYQLTADGLKDLAARETQLHPVQTTGKP